MYTGLPFGLVLYSPFFDVWAHTTFPLILLYITHLDSLLSGLLVFWTRSASGPRVTPSASGSHQFMGHSWSRPRSRLYSPMCGNFFFCFLIAILDSHQIESILRDRCEGIHIFVMDHTCGSCDCWWNSSCAGLFPWAHTRRG